MIKNRLTVIFLSTFAVFIFFLTPNVTTGDGGELATTAYFLGVAHPSGYPLYLLVAKTLIFLPFGNIAFKVAITSAFASALVLTLLYWLIQRLTSSNWSAFFTISLLLQSYAFFTQSVIAKFYPLNLLIILLIFTPWILLLFFNNSKHRALSSPDITMERAFQISAFLLGLSLSNHHTGLIIAGPVFLASILFFYIAHKTNCGATCEAAGDTAHPSRLTALRTYAVQWSKIAIKSFIPFILGAMISVYLILRGSEDSFFTPSVIGDFDTFCQVFFRQAYGSGGTLSIASNTLGGSNIASYGHALINSISILIASFSLFSIPVFIAGCLLLLKRNISVFIFVIACIFVYGPFLALLTLSNPDLSEKDYYIHASQHFLPAMMLYVIIAGMGFCQIFLWIRKLDLRIILRCLPAVFAIFPLFFLGERSVDSNYRTNHVAYQLPKDSLSILPVNSVIVGIGDNAVFQGWYMKVAGRYREDICQLSAVGTKMRAWKFHACKPVVYMNTVPMIFSQKFEEFAPLMMKGRFYGSAFIFSDSAYGDYITSDVFSLVYLYYPKNKHIPKKREEGYDTFENLLSRQINADKLIYPSVCLSHLTDDVFTRHLCFKYTAAMTKLAQYYSGEEYGRTGHTYNLTLRDGDTPDKRAYIDTKIHITNKNMSILKHASAIGDFNKWDIFFLRNRD